MTFHHPYPRISNFGYRFSQCADQPGSGRPSEDRMMAMLTQGLWGALFPDESQDHAFIFHLPAFRGDNKGSGVCTTTGYLSAGSGLVNVDGMQFVDAFAPNQVVKP